MDAQDARMAAEADAVQAETRREQANKSGSADVGRFAASAHEWAARAHAAAADAHQAAARSIRDIAGRSDVGDAEWDEREATKAALAAARATAAATTTEAEEEQPDSGRSRLPDPF